MLEDQAVELADRMGTLRLASPENMASLMCAFLRFSGRWKKGC